MCGPALATVGAPTDWPDYLGGADSSQFSPLDQIRVNNVHRLQQVWAYALPEGGQSIGNPLVISGHMYLPWSGGVVALDAGTGEEIWHHETPGLQMRGLSSWLDPSDGSRRLFYQRDNRMYALDAATGRLIGSFGSNGAVDLRQGLGRAPASIVRIESRSPGRVFGNLIIVGSTGGDAWNGPPGHIRAFDVRSGALVWTFHTIPRPGERYGDQWPTDAWKTVGGVNNWTGTTLDDARGILYVPLASANYNFYGGNRSGNNLYANSLVALEARTGRYLWHYQTVHHDLWDYDLPQAPKLLSLSRNGREVPAVLVATKTGFVFTFHRETGQPLFPIEEKPVPPSDVPGEYASPTQPFPLAPPPFSRQTITLEDVNPALGKPELERLRYMLSGLRNEGLFTPPSLQGSMAMPGTSGGTNWGNGAVDPRKGRFFVVSIEMPSILRLVDPAAARTGAIMTTTLSRGAQAYLEHCALCHGEDRTGQPPAVPSLLGIASRATRESVTSVIRRGRTTMPGFELNADLMDSLLVELGFAADPPATRPQRSATDAPHREPERGEERSEIDYGPIRYKSGYNLLFSEQGLPAITPPWSTLTAYDMQAGSKLWQVPFGGIPGHENVGALLPRGTLLATAGGLLFAGTQDRSLTAWDADTGEVRLRTPLPSTPAGVPASYLANGRQFIALAAASDDPATAHLLPPELRAAGRNSIVAFALPELHPPKDNQ